jgi:4-amino-4-deoxy-L-arabinose transferase-like glycosyltransferase
MIGWLIVGVTLAVGYGWAARLLRQKDSLSLYLAPYQSGWLTVLLGLALSVSALTLIMLAEGLLGIPLTLVGIAVPYFALMLPGWWRVRLTMPRLPSGWERRFALLLLLALSVAILFNGAYLPFSRDDTLGIYQPAAQAIYRMGALVPVSSTLNVYNTYPMLVQLSYAYAYFASGWENEYLAKTIATLLSLACIPAAYVLGAQIRGERAGWLAALILALTPFYSRWASSGYVDLPMAFFFTLAAIFALHLSGSRGWINALLTGALIGLAAWTKNAALLAVPLLVIGLVWLRYRTRIRWQYAALALFACAVVAAPWYVRNLLDAGYIIPATAWTDQAQRTLGNALVFITHTQDFGVSGWLIVGGIVATVALIIRRPFMFTDRVDGEFISFRTLKAKQRYDAAVQAAPGQVLILLWTLPFFAAWWLFVSYDPRFLLLFLPLLCALAGDWLVRLWDSLDRAWNPRYRIALALLILIFITPILWQAVEYKSALLRHPLMTDAEKRALVGRSPEP